MTLTISGDGKVLRAMIRISEEIQGDFAEEIEDLVIEIFSESQAQVPVDTGILRGSGFIRRKFGPALKLWEIGYTTEYAVIVHEDLRARHNGATKARYLTDPFHEKTAALLNRLTKAVKRALK